jgi:hypothetical protein
MAFRELARAAAEGLPRRTEARSANSKPWPRAITLIRGGDRHVVSPGVTTAPESRCGLPSRYQRLPRRRAARISHPSPSRPPPTWLRQHRRHPIKTRRPPKFRVHGRQMVARPDGGAWGTERRRERQAATSLVQVTDRHDALSAYGLADWRWQHHSDRAPVRRGVGLVFHALIPTPAARPRSWRRLTQRLTLGLQRFGPRRRALPLPLKEKTTRGNGIYLATST